MVWEGSKSALSFGFGTFLIVLGVWPLLSQLGIFMAPPAAVMAWVPALVPWLFLVGGLFLLIDAFGEWGGWYCWASVIIGIIVGLLSLLMFAYQLGVIGFNIPLPPTVYYILFILEGVFLIIGAFTQL